MIARTAPIAPTSRRPEEGSSIVEVLVAATLTIVAVAMLAGDAVPALRMLEGSAQPDLRRAELVNAGEVVARAVRAARPEVSRAAVEGDEQRLSIVLGPGAVLDLTLDAGTLVLTIDGAHTGTAPFPTGVLVEGLDPERSRFSLVDAEGAVAGEATPIAAVTVVLADGEDEVVRVVGLRMRSHLDGAAAW